MSKRPFVLFGIFAAICLVVIPYFALAKEGDEDAGLVQVEDRDREAQQMFATNCGTCHTLAAAGTDGVVGPDLDAVLVPSGTNDAQLYEGNASRVLNAVQCGLGGRMPAGILEEEEASEVSRFVAAYAGQIDKGPVVDTADTPLPEPQPCAGSGG
jgi:mono/diheme cytochrome c family protein